MQSLTDCPFYLTDTCIYGENCRNRHCRQAADQTESCKNWPAICRSVNCGFRHPKVPRPILPEARLAPVFPRSAPSGLVSFFWDLENVAIPRKQQPFEIVTKLRQKLLIERGLRENAFSCYCNVTMMHPDIMLSIHRANVRIVHVPDKKVNAADREISLELDRFERANSPPATIVLISGDIDFIGKLNDLRHRVGFTVIVVHNRPARAELKAAATENFLWSDFTEELTKIPRPRTPAGHLAKGQPKARRTEHPPRPKLSDKEHIKTLMDATSLSSGINAPGSSTDPNTMQTQQCVTCTAQFNTAQELQEHQEATYHGDYNLLDLDWSPDNTEDKPPTPLPTNGDDDTNSDDSSSSKSSTPPPPPVCDDNTDNTELLISIFDQGINSLNSIFINPESK